MDSNKIFDVLKRYKSVLENMGYKVIYIGLYGSQNYNLSDEISDLDAKAIILPSLSNIISGDYICEHIKCDEGDIEVRDLMSFYNIISKGSFSYLESINTPYSLGDDFIKELFLKIPLNYKSIIHAMCEKRSALTYKYPSKSKVFNDFGCDPKQFHHIVRLHDLLIFNLENNSELSYLKYDGSKRDYLISLKRGMNGKSVNDLILESDELISEAKDIFKKYRKDYVYKNMDLSKEIGKYLEDKIRETLLSD